MSVPHSVPYLFDAFWGRLGTHMAANGRGCPNGLKGLGGENARISALIGGGGVRQDNNDFNLLSGFKMGIPYFVP